MKIFRCLTTPLLLLAAGCSGAGDDAAATVPYPTPQAAVDDLLAADRAFAEAAAEADATRGLSAMFAEDVIMPSPPGFAEGRDEVVAALARAPGSAGGRLEWAPVRGGVSADGQHGFTYGYMTLHRADGTTVPLKYLSYWTRGREGWRVAAYKRRPRPEGAVSSEMMAPALPAFEASQPDPAITEAFRVTLIAAEKAFSDEAQVIGLGRAFTRHGSADAMNMGGPGDAAFVLSAEAIGSGMGLDSVPSPVSWSADRAIVASSGDLGVTFGMIRLNQPPADSTAPSAFPFFTIWRRAGPDAPWRYVAE